MRRFLFVVLALLPACSLLIDLDPLGSGRRPDAGTSPDGAPVVDASTPDSPATEASADASFCSAFPGVGVCDDFDHGKTNPALTYLPELGDNQGEMRIVNDAFVSRPSSLYVSIIKNGDVNIREFLFVTSPRTGTKTSLHFAFRPVTTDFIIFANVDCELPGGDFDGLSLFLAPDGTVSLAHSYNTDEKAVGKISLGGFTPFDLAIVEGGGRLTGTLTIGDTPSTPIDRPVGCRSGGGHRVRLGIEGSGGKPSVQFDNLVYDVTP